jgi:hypothetical protein
VNFLCFASLLIVWRIGDEGSPPHSPVLIAHEAWYYYNGAPNSYPYQEMGVEIAW